MIDLKRKKKGPVYAGPRKKPAEEASSYPAIFIDVRKRNFVKR